ncbi:MAG: diaminopimelate epimerase, partial [Synergistaceae bacterium]|nr:diaminopimelate epimerase [Synergistaceae bacterium]
MKFTKMHGNGNDFIVIENMAKNNSLFLNKEELSEMAIKLCNRKTSIGADGVLVVEEHQTPPNDKRCDFRMRLFNADGSEAEMCGNGARCIAKYAFRNKICGVNAAFSTPAGIMRAVINENSGKVDLDMGRIMLPGGVSCQRMTARGIKFDYVFLTVGVPHCVIFADNMDLSDRAKLFSLGREIRNDAARFPKGANVNFTKKTDGDIWNITYERGVEDLTESCGTGSVAAAIAMECIRGESSPLKIRNLGGINEVTLKFD